MSIQKIDFEKDYKKHWAIFCHAISEIYARYFFNENARHPKNYSTEDLNFFNKNTRLFYLPWGLFSAGQAAKTDANIIREKNMVSNRNREEVKFIIGDSGGFQIETGAIKWEGNKTKERMLKWLENNCEISMILDFPTGAIKKRYNQFYEEYCYDEQGRKIYEIIKKTLPNGKIKEKKIHKKIKHIPDFWFCLERTMENNDYFILNRIPNKTKFLNVLQGRYHDFSIKDDFDFFEKFPTLSIKEKKEALTNKKISEIDAWYYSVRKYSTDYKDRSFEGWAFAGNYKNCFDFSLRRLVIMMYDGLLEKSDWLHFLGMGQVPIICLYTVIQNMIRNHPMGNKNFTISCDASSAFSAAGAYGLVYSNYNLTSKTWSLSFDKILEGEKYINSNEPWITKSGINLTEKYNSPISLVTTLGDLNIKKGNGGRTFDGDSYVFLMHHNVYFLQKVIMEGLTIFDMKEEDSKYLIPKEVLEIKHIIEDVFSLEGRDNMLRYIKKYSNVLRKLAISSDNNPVVSEIENDELFFINREEKKIKKNSNIKTKEVTVSNNFNDFFS